MTHSTFDLPKTEYLAGDDVKRQDGFTKKGYIEHGKLNQVAGHLYIYDTYSANG